MRSNRIIFTSSRPSCILPALLVMLAGGLTQAYGGIIYSQDPNLAHFTATVDIYGTFTAGVLSSGGGAGIPSSNPYTPTSAILQAAGYAREIGTNSGPTVNVDVDLGVAKASIIVFDNIDHVGNAWDVFQYQIFGSVDGSSYNLLFNPLTASLVPSTTDQFTLDTYTGTAPTLVNNTLTPGLGPLCQHD